MLRRLTSDIFFPSNCVRLSVRETAEYLGMKLSNRRIIEVFPELLFTFPLEKIFVEMINRLAILDISVGEVRTQSKNRGEICVPESVRVVYEQGNRAAIPAPAIVIMSRTHKLPDHTYHVVTVDETPWKLEYLDSLEEVGYGIMAILAIDN